MNAYGIAQVDQLARQGPAVRDEQVGGDRAFDTERGAEIANVDAPVWAGPATTRLARYWPHLLVPPNTILLFGLHQRLTSARRPAVR